ncbi:MAG: alpha/beta fold hydrolase [Proteobacteria bacterium]|nr:alpha/beta fold hydrolase [Pseudomonadota bacterium]
MPKVFVNGINLYYEEAGSGAALLFLHEFGSDHRGWEPQMRFFSRRYRCITCAYRGYPPSDVPERPEDYSQDHLNADAVGLMDALGIDRAHLCGLSIGANTAVFLGISRPERLLSIVVAGGGHGSVKGQDRAHFERDFRSRAERLLKEGMEPVADELADAPIRRPFKVKDPRGWQEFRDRFARHSARGSAYTALGVPLRRPSYYQIEDRLRTMRVPTLILVGDQDEVCLEGSLFLKRVAPLAGLHMLPMSGHTLNLEEPDLFNRAVLDFLTAVEQGRWVRP